MSLLGKMVRTVDQATGSVGPRRAINQYIRDYGEITELAIDTDRKRISAQLLLHGERVPLQVCVEAYEVVKTGSSVSLLVKAASSDRAWLDAVLNRFLVGRPWEIPAKAAALVDGFLG